MKLIVEADQKTIDECKKLFADGYSNDAEYAIANGKPYEERPKGEWITIKPFYELIDGHYQETHSKLDFVKCPFCETIYHGRHNFCGRCGADMRGGEDS